MKYKVKVPFSVVTKPMTVAIVDGEYVREISERQYLAGDVLTATKSKGLDVKALAARGVVAPIEEKEADDAR